VICEIKQRCKSIGVVGWRPDEGIHFKGTATETEIKNRKIAFIFFYREGRLSWSFF